MGQKVPRFLLRSGNFLKKSAIFREKCHIELHFGAKSAPIFTSLWEFPEKVIVILIMKFSLKVFVLKYFEIHKYERRPPPCGGRWGILQINRRAAPNFLKDMSSRKQGEGSGKFSPDINSKGPCVLSACAY